MKVTEVLTESSDSKYEDHEIQMAKSDLHKMKEYVDELYDMLDGMDESEGLPAWVQAKIIKAADYLSAVYHYMDHEAEDDMKHEIEDDMDHEKDYESLA